MSVVSLFGRVEVESPQTIFDSAFLYDKEALLWDEITATDGTGTFVTNGSCIDLAVTSSTGSRVVRQTKRYLPYQPGKTFNILCTGVLQTTLTPGIRSRIGLFDNHSDKSVDTGGDGVFFQHNGTTAAVAVRSYITGSQVDNVVNQASWNIDKMDGTGPSGITVDWTKRQIFVFSLQWLGVGEVVCALSIGGKTWPVHVFNHSNLTDSKPYMRRAALPVRYEIENVSSGSGATMRQICTTVFSGGGFNPRGKIFAHRRSTDVTLGTANETFAIALRMKSTQNRRTINPLSINAVCTSGGAIILRCYLYATLTNATFAEAFTGSGFSAAEIDIAATAFTTTNAVRVLDVGFSDKTDSLVTSFENTLLISSDIAGTSDIMVVTLQRKTAQSETVTLSIQWQEY